MRPRYLLIPLLALLLAACVHTPLPEEGECERLHPRLAYCLLAPAAMGGQLQRLDMVRVEGPEASHRFVGQLSVADDRLDLAAYSPTGVGLFRLQWDGETLDHDAPSEEMAIPPARLVALLQWVLAPIEALDGAVHGGRVTQRETEGGRERSLVLDNGETVATASIALSDGRPAAMEIRFGEQVHIRLTPLE